MPNQTHRPPYVLQLTPRGWELRDVHAAKIATNATLSGLSVVAAQMWAAAVCADRLHVVVTGWRYLGDGTDAYETMTAADVDRTPGSPATPTSWETDYAGYRDTAVAWLDTVPHGVQDRETVPLGTRVAIAQAYATLARAEVAAAMLRHAETTTPGDSSPTGTVGWEPA